MKKIRNIFYVLLVSLLVSGVFAELVPQTNIVTEVQAATKPGMPKLVSATPSGGTKIVVKWKAVTGAKGYYVYRKTADSSWKKIKTVTGQTKVSYTDKSCEKGIIYYYTVRAYKTSGGKNILGSYNKTGLGTVLLDTPKITELKMTAPGKNTVDITWSGVNGAEGYRLYCRRNDETAWTRIYEHKGAVSTGTYTYGSCGEGRTYYFKVRGYKTVNGKKVWSAYGNSSIQTFTIPKLVSAEITKNKTITLKWSQVDQVSGFRVYRKVNGGKWELQKKIGNEYAVSYEDTNVSIGNSYEYTVRSYKKINGKTILSGYVNPGIKVNWGVSAPFVWTQSSGFNVVVHWDAIEGADGYRAYRRKENETTWERLVTQKENGQYSYVYIDKDTKIGETYYYKVRGYTNTSGGKVWGSYNKTEKKYTVQLPDVQSYLGVRAKNTSSITLAWPIVNGASGYQLYTKKNGEWEVLATLSGEDTLQYTVTGLMPSTTYSFTVRPYKVIDGETVWGKYNEEGISTATDSAELQLNKSEVALTCGEIYRDLELVGTSNSAVWKSSDESVVKIITGDYLYAVANGTAYVTATYEDVEYVCKVIVETPEFKVDKMHIEVGESIYASVEGTVRAVRWLLDDEYECTEQGVSNDCLKMELVDENTVKITGLKPGKSQIYAGIERKGFGQIIYVDGLIDMPTESLTLDVGEKTEVIITTNFDELELDDANNTSVAEANLTKLSDGQWKLELLGVSSGTATIIVTDLDFACGVYKGIRVTVEDSNSVASNNFKLKRYVQNNGSYSEGWYIIGYAGYYEDSPELLYTWTISYNPTSDEYEYGLAVTSSEEMLVMVMTGNPTKSSNMKVEYMYYDETTEGSFVAESALNMNTYSGQNLTFKVTESENMATADLNELMSIANDTLVLAFDGWQEYVLKGHEFSLQSLGFKVYPTV